MIIADRVLFYDGVIVVEVSHQGGIKLQPVIGPGLTYQGALGVGRGKPAYGLRNAKRNDGQADKHSDVGIESGQGKGEEPHNHDIAHPDELKEEIELRMVLCRAGTVVNNYLAQSGGIWVRIWGTNALDVLFAEKLFLVRGGHCESAHGQVHRGWPASLRLREGRVPRGLIMSRREAKMNIKWCP